MPLVTFMKNLESAKGSLSSLIEFLTTESPLKIKEKDFHFNLRALFVLQIFKFLSCIFDYTGKNKKVT